MFCCWNCPHKLSDAGDVNWFSVSEQSTLIAPPHTNSIPFHIPLRCYGHESYFSIFNRSPFICLGVSSAVLVSTWAFAFIYYLCRHQFRNSRSAQHIVHHVCPVCSHVCSTINCFDIVSGAIFWRMLFTYYRYRCFRTTELPFSFSDFTFGSVRASAVCLIWSSNSAEAKPRVIII